MKTDRYNVSVPGDLDDSIERLGHYAIEEAKSRTRLFCIPATWIATHLDGELGDFSVAFLVKRYRN